MNGKSKKYTAWVLKHYAPDYYFSENGSHTKGLKCAAQFFSLYEVEMFAKKYSVDLDDDRVGIEEVKIDPAWN